MVTQTPFLLAHPLMGLKMGTHAAGFAKPAGYTLLITTLGIL